MKPFHRIIVGRKKKWPSIREANERKSRMGRSSAFVTTRTQGGSQRLRQPFRTTRVKNRSRFHWAGSSSDCALWSVINQIYLRPLGTGKCVRTPITETQGRFSVVVLSRPTSSRIFFPPFMLLWWALGRRRNAPGSLEVRGPADFHTLSKRQFWLIAGRWRMCEMLGTCGSQFRLWKASHSGKLPKI